MNLRTAIASVLLASCSTVYGDPGHDIKDHTSLMEDAFCVASYAYGVRLAIQAKEGVHITRDLETRGRGLAITLLQKADKLGHTQHKTAEMLAEVTLNMERLQFDDWLRFVEYLDCRGRTDRYATAYWYY